MTTTRKGAKRAATRRPDFTTENKTLTARVVSLLEQAGTGGAVLAEAPPGADKSSLTYSVANALVTADAGLTLPIVTQTNEQADDIVASLMARFPRLVVGRLVASAGASPAIVAMVPGGRLRVGKQSTGPDLQDARIIVGTARKWQYERDRLNGTRQFDYALIDEAYQMRSDALLGIAGLFRTLFCVGDPGQIDPFAEIDDALWRGLPYSPTRAAMATLRAFHPGLHVEQLPTSWRLPSSAASIVSSAFYPFAPFAAGTTPEQRALDLGRAGRGTDGRANDLLARAASTGWAYLELPERYTVRTDDEVATALALTVEAALRRQSTVVDERDPSGHPLGPERIAVVTAHNDQVHAVRYELAQLGVDPDTVVVSTANKIQGREYDVTLVWHPLAGRRDATSFHLEAGRMCVMLSRHKQACIVVGRAGADRLLAEFPDSDPIFLDEPEKFPDGWQANSEVLEFLGGHCC